jgi:hypothetical protein
LPGWSELVQTGQQDASDFDLGIRGPLVGTTDIDSFPKTEPRMRFRIGKPRSSSGFSIPGAEQARWS